MHRSRITYCHWWIFPFMKPYWRPSFYRISHVQESLSVANLMCKMLYLLQISCARVFICCISHVQDALSVVNPMCEMQAFISAVATHSQLECNLVRATWFYSASWKYDCLNVNCVFQVFYSETRGGRTVGNGATLDVPLSLDMLTTVREILTSLGR